MTYELKDLFRAIKSYCVFINRTGDKMSDRNMMIDYRQEALECLDDYERKYELSKCMKRFLVHRICRTVKQQANW